MIEKENIKGNLSKEFYGCMLCFSLLMYEGYGITQIGYFFVNMTCREKDSFGCFVGVFVC